MTANLSNWERPRLESYHDAYRLAAPWRTDCKGVLADAQLTVDQGFVTDGASIPRFLWRVCGTPMDVPRIYAAIVHDWLYTAGHHGSYTRADADRIYRDYQIALGISRLKAYTEYYALRVFAGGHWED